MSALVANFLGAFASLSWEDDRLAAVPPTPAADSAAKGLRKLCEQATGSGATEDQSRIGKDVIASLMNRPAEGPMPLSLLCDAIQAGTAAIDAIDCQPEADTLECG
jgi:hypothetical protein